MISSFSGCMENYKNFSPQSTQRTQSSIIQKTKFKKVTAFLGISILGTQAFKRI